MRLPTIDTKALSQLFLNCFEVIKKFDANRALKDAQTCTSCTHIHTNTHWHTHAHARTHTRQRKEIKKKRGKGMVSWPLRRFLFCSYVDQVTHISFKLCANVCSKFKHGKGPVCLQVRNLIHYCRLLNCNYDFIVASFAWDQKVFGNRIMFLGFFCCRIFRTWVILQVPTQEKTDELHLGIRVARSRH